MLKVVQIIRWCFREKISKAKTLKILKDITEGKDCGIIIENLNENDKKKIKEILADKRRINGAFLIGRGV